MIYSGQRQPGNEICEAISKALKIPPEEVFRYAGLLSYKTDADKLLDHIEYLYNQLEDPTNKKRALDFLEFLMIQNEKGEYRVQGKAERVPAKSD